MPRWRNWNESFPDTSSFSTFDHTIFAFLVLAIPTLSVAETIKGNACYRFSDKESISAARHIALSMAKRDALEGYAVFVESSSGVENFSLKNDLITSVTAGLMRRIRIVKKTENFKKREVCRWITAEIRPIELKQKVVAKINAYRRGKANIPTGLPFNKYMKVLKIKKITNWYNSNCPRPDRCIEVTAICKKSSDKVIARITWFDDNGIPVQTFKGRKSCELIGDIINFVLRNPPSHYTFKIDLF